MNPQDRIAANMATVEAHFHSEADDEVDKALDLYTDDIVWEAPARRLIFRGKQAVADNYRKMFASIQNIRHEAQGGDQRAEKADLDAFV